MQENRANKESLQEQTGTGPSARKGREQTLHNVS